MSVAQKIELLARGLSGITITFILDSGQRAKIPDSPIQYRTPGNPIYNLLL